MSYEKIQFEIDSDIATLRLNQPQTMNGLSEAMQNEIIDACASVESNRAIRALILTGTGRAFCSGASLDGMQKPRGDLTVGQDSARAMRESSNPMQLKLRALPVPTVCALNGAAAGAGIGIALACDIVVAARSASLVMAFAPKLGLVPDLGVSWFLPRLIGHARAVGMTLLGDKLGAQTAADWGLIWKCVDDSDLGAETLQLARRLARLPAHAITEVRNLYARSEQSSYTEQLAYEADRQGWCIDEPSFAEGVRAFFERREPNFPPR